MKVPRRSLFAFVVGFLFPGFGSGPSPTPPAPELQLTKKSNNNTSNPLVVRWSGYTYTCPLHGDVSLTTMRFSIPAGNDGTAPVQDTFCLLCIYDQLKKLPIARLGE